MCGRARQRREQVVLLHGELVPEGADPSLKADLQQGGRLLHPPVRPRLHHLPQAATVAFGLHNYGGVTHFTIKEGKQHQSCQFPWEAGGTSVHPVKDESYKEFAACMGSNLPSMHLAMQTNKEIALEIAGANQGIHACIRPGAACTPGACCFSIEETYLHVLQPHTHMFVIDAFVGKQYQRHQRKQQP
jgi:hypothetical protein